MERCLVGIDWATEHNQVEVQSPDGTVIVQEVFPSSSEGFRELRDALLETCQEPSKIRVAIEDPTRGVVRVLLEAGMQVFVLPPRKLDSLRPVYSEAEAKDDVLDAHILCEELRTHEKIFYELVDREPVIATLSRYHRAFEDEKSDVSRYSNGLREMLRDYFPQFLELEWSLTQRVMLDLLKLIPSPEAVQEVSVDQVDEVLGRARKHSAREVLEILSAEGPPMAQRIIDSMAEIAAREAEKLRAALANRRQWESRLRELLEEISEKQKAGELPSAREAGNEAEPSSERDTENSAEHAEGSLSDIEIALSTDGVGFRTVAGLFAEGFEALVTLDREMLRRQSIAPVTKQTGRQSSSGKGPPPQVHQRYARNRYLTDTMHQLGDSLQRKNSHYRAKYVKMRDDKNHTHGRSCRQLTDQYLRVLFAMLRDRTTYDPTLHGATRR